MGYLTRIIKRPSLVLNQNFLFHPISAIDTSRQILSHKSTLMESISKLTGESHTNIEKYYKSISENSELLDHLTKQFSLLDDYLKRKELNSKFFKDNPAGRLGRESQPYAGFFLYMLVRATKPDFFVETGVSGGESSAFILQAMEDNKKGELHSIDFPQAVVEKGLTTVTLEEKPSGWLIPDRIKQRWHLKLGKSEEVLEPLLEQLGKIDIFFHDSLHTYEHMMFEYNTSWKYLKRNGILISDDIVVMNGKGHSPFVDFANQMKQNMVIYNVVGGINKSDLIGQE